MASEWPFAWCLGGGQAGWDPSMEPEYDDAEPHSVPYIHRDAARAWQAFRDWLNFGDLDEAGDMYGDEWDTQS